MLKICVVCLHEFEVRIAPDGRNTCQIYCSDACVKALQKKKRKEKYAACAVRCFKRIHNIDLTIDQVETLQNAPCDICNKKAGIGSLKSQRNHIDHDHVTNKIRGTLCYRCNSAVGLLRDDVTLFQKAIEYLSRSLR